MQILNSGYSNYGANTTKKSLIGWNYAGGSAREDINDNLSMLRQRSRDVIRRTVFITITIDHSD